MKKETKTPSKAPVKQSSIVTKNVKSGTLLAMNQERNTYLVKMLNKQKAWKRGQNPWITMEDPNNPKQMIKVKANSIWGIYNKQ